jgi:hypothetical protein
MSRDNKTGMIGPVQQPQRFITRENPSRSRIVNRGTTPFFSCPHGGGLPNWLLHRVDCRFGRPDLLVRFGPAEL